MVEEAAVAVASAADRLKPGDGGAKKGGGGGGMDGSAA
jgi:hypothetical protein